MIFNVIHKTTVAILNCKKAKKFNIMSFLLENLIIIALISIPDI